MNKLLQRLEDGAAWYLCRCLPINPKKVLLSSYYGKSYGDSPKAIAEELHRRRPDLELYWLCAGTEAERSLPPYIRPVKLSSVSRVYALSTSKVWVDNCRKGAHFKRDTQAYMQTWHGFALKQIEKDAEDALEESYIAMAQRDSSQIDLLVSDSSFMTEVYRRAFWYEGEIAELGLPRNDKLIQGNPEAAGQVRSSLQVPEDSRMVLYAPTFRADHSMEAYRLDFDGLRRACEQRFGGSFTVLVRLHPNISGQASVLLEGHTGVVNASDYPDSQELLEAADVLVTDYSSIMFDYMLTGKPCLQYASDIADYVRDRNFYLPLDSLPFPLAETAEALEQAVLGFDEAAYREAVEAFQARQGIIADGEAAKRCADWILEQLAH